MNTIDRYKRLPITLPSGRTIYGRIPGFSGGHLTEHRLRDELARHLRGATEVTLPYGRADVATNNVVIEVEPAEQWRTAVRQALAYSAQTGLTPGVALFGAAKPAEVLRIYLELRDGQPPIRLWWWWHIRWEAITNRKACRAMPAPTAPPAHPSSLPTPPPPRPDEELFRDHVQQYQNQRAERLGI